MQWCRARCVEAVDLDVDVLLLTESICSTNCLLFIVSIPADIEDKYPFSTLQIKPNTASFRRDNENPHLQPIVEVPNHAPARGHLHATTEHAVNTPVLHEHILQAADCQRAREDENPALRIVQFRIHDRKLVE